MTRLDKIAAEGALRSVKRFERRAPDVMWSRQTKLTAQGSGIAARESLFWNRSIRVASLASIQVATFTTIP
jgi:hypothetical protein